MKIQKHVPLQLDQNIEETLFILFHLISQTIEETQKHVANVAKQRITPVANHNE